MKYSFLVSLAVTLFFYLVWVVNYLFYPANIEIIMCDVGQGDSFLIQQAFRQIIVDGGPDNRLLECLGDFMPFWDKKIEVIILTHPQTDHMNGLIEVINRYKVVSFIYPGYQPENSKDFELLIKALAKEKQIQFHQPISGEIIHLGQLQLKFLWPLKKYNNFKADSAFDPNQISVVFELNYKHFRGLFTGDIGFPEEQALISNGLLRDVDVLKVAHHGSKYSSSADFIRLVSPEVVLIGVGVTNRFGHPHPDVIKLFSETDAKIFRTDKQGSIKITSDGKQLHLP